LSVSIKSSCSTPRGRAPEHRTAVLLSAVLVVPCASWWPAAAMAQTAVPACPIGKCVRFSGAPFTAASDILPLGVPAWRGVSGLDELEGRAVVKLPDICACDRPTPEFRVGLQDALIVDGFATVDEFRSWLLEAIVREPLVAEVQVTALCDRMFDGGQS